MLKLNSKFKIPENLLNIALNRAVFNNTNYVIPANYNIIAQIGTLTAPCIVTLPAINANMAGYVIWVIDESGTCNNTNIITIQCAGSATINGGTSTVMNEPYAIKRFETDGISKWTCETVVTSFNGRTGRILSQIGDYTSDIISNESTLDGDTITQTLDLCFGIQRTEQTIYLATTGNDNTGDGSSGNPFYSIHKALSVIKRNILEVTVTIMIADGAYDYSTLGELFFDKNIVLGTAGGQFEIRAQSGIAGFTVLDSGTFSSQPDTDSNVHTDGTKAWTPDTYIGKFLKVKTMNSGILPSNGDGDSYSYRYVPIIKNTATEIHTSFIGLGATQSQNIAQYDIVDYPVSINIGANDILVSDSFFGVLNFNCIKIIGTGRIIVGYEHNSELSQMACFVAFHNCHLNVTQFFGMYSYLMMSFLQTNNMSQIGNSDCSAFNTTYNQSIVSKYYTSSALRHCVFRNSYSSSAGNMISFLTVEESPALSYRTAFYDIDSCVDMGIGYLNISSKFYFTGCDFFSELSSLTGRFIYASMVSYFAFKNEPTLGRLTTDGINPITYYVDINIAYNAEILSPTPVDAKDASQLHNDSLVTGTTIKDALDTVQGHLVSTSNPHSVTKTQVGLGNVTNDAQLKRAAGDFDTFAEKATPVVGDIILIEDSEDTNAKKKIQFGNMPYPTALLPASQVSTLDPLKSAQDYITQFDGALSNQVSVIGLTIDGGGNVITVGSKGYRWIQFSGTIISWTLFSDAPAGSIEIDVKKGTYAGFPVTASIAGTELPMLTVSQKNQDLSLDTWTTAFSEGDIFEYVVNSCDLCTKVYLFIKVQKDYP